MFLMIYTGIWLAVTITGGIVRLPARKTANRRRLASALGDAPQLCAALYTRREGSGQQLAGDNWTISLRA
jgi:hypothetical protein